MSYTNIADVSDEFVRDVAHRLVFSDEDYPGVLDVGFLAPASSPVHQETIGSRYHHPNNNKIKREAWRSARYWAIERIFSPTGDEVAVRFGWVLPAHLWNAEYYGWCHVLHRTLPRQLHADLYIHQDFTVEIYHKNRM